MPRRLKNLTITVEPDVLDWAGQEAQRHGMSVSRLVGDLVRQARGDLVARPVGASEEGEPLPGRLRRLFWEFDFEALRWPADRDLVVAKILEAGDLDGFAWLRSTVGRDHLRSWLIARGGRGLDLKQIRFWATVLGIPGELADRWTRALEDDPWANRLGS